MKTDRLHLLIFLMNFLFGSVYLTRSLAFTSFWSPVKLDESANNFRTLSRRSRHPGNKRPIQSHDTRNCSNRSSRVLLFRRDSCRSSLANPQFRTQLFCLNQFWWISSVSSSTLTAQRSHTKYNGCFRGFYNRNSIDWSTFWNLFGSEQCLRFKVGYAPPSNFTVFRSCHHVLCP